MRMHEISPEHTMHMSYGVMGVGTIQFCFHYFTVLYIPIVT
jgi:hypothetical protein